MPIFDHNRELLDRFRRGDRAAPAEVYEHYVDDVAQLERYLKRFRTVKAHRERRFFGRFAPNFRRGGS